MAINFPATPTLNETYTSGSSTWQWNGTVWNLVGSTGGVTINSFATISGNIGSTTANTATDTLSVVGGSSISTSVSGDTLTINYTGGSGSGTDQNLWYTIQADSGVTSANTTTDALTIAGGTDITTSISGDTLTINYTGSGGGANSINDLTDVNTSGVATGDLLVYNGTTFVPTGRKFATMYMPAITMLNVSNSGTSAYLFSPHYSGNNPTVYALAGTTIAFDLTNALGHPFEIQDPTATAYNTGLVHVDVNGVVSTGASAQGKSAGVLYWQIPESISGNYRYQCTAHVAMVGAISIKRLSVV